MTWEEIEIERLKKRDAQLKSDFVLNNIDFFIENVLLLDIQLPL
jgi:hypothetical protein